MPSLSTLQCIYLFIFVGRLELIMLSPLKVVLFTTLSMYVCMYGGMLNRPNLDKEYYNHNECGWFLLVIDSIAKK